MILTAKTKNQILEQIYHEKEIRFAVKNILKNPQTKYHEDLFHDLILNLGEKDEEKLLEIYNEGYIFWYCIRFFTNNVNSDRSDFHKVYRKQSRVEEPLTDWQHQNQEEKTIKEELLPLIPYIKVHIQSMHWYEQRIFFMFQEEEKSMREISRLTGIPLNSIANTINKVRKEVKNKLNKDGYLN